MSRHSYLEPYIAELAKSILTIQNPDGSLPVDLGGKVPGAWVTSSLLWSTLLPDKDYSHLEERYSQACDWLTNNSNPDGGYPYRTGTPSAVDPTASVLEFFAMCQLRGLANEDTAETYAIASKLLLQQHEQGWWPFHFGSATPSSVSTALAARALLRALELPGGANTDYREAVDRARSWFLKLLSSVGVTRVPTLTTTADIAHFLYAFHTQLDETIYHAACETLLQSRDPDGLWSEKIERHEGISIIRVSTPYCIASLAFGRNTEATTMHFLVRKLLEEIRDGKIFHRGSQYVWTQRDVLAALVALHTSPYVTSLPELLSRNASLEELAAWRGAHEKLKRLLPDAVEQCWENRVKAPIRILHLSDLHFGEYQREREYTLNARDVVKDLQQMRKLPVDYLVVTGDITSNTNPDRSRQVIEFNEACVFIRSLGEQLGLTENRWIVIPGNHDIMWYSSEAESGSENVRCQDLNYQNFYLNLHGTEPSRPFLCVTSVDIARNVAFMGLNSCMMEEDEASSWIGCVGNDQLEYAWNELLTKSRSEHTTMVKIALLHHHLLPVSYIQDIPKDQKRISMTLDAEGVIKRLLSWRFDLVLHGHQHQPFIAIESRVHEGDIHAGIEGIDWHQSLVVVGGGSLGAPRTKLGRIGQNTYNIIEITPEGITVFTRQSHPFEPTGYSALLKHTIARV